MGAGQSQQSQYSSGQMQAFEFAPAPAEKAGQETGIWRASEVKGGELATTLHPDCTTLWQNWERSIKLYGDRPLWGKRSSSNGSVGPFEWLSYKQAAERVNNAGSGFRALGAVQGDKIGLYSINRIEWVVAEYGGFRTGMVTVPVYDTLGENVVEYIAGQAELKVIVCSKDVLKKAVEAANAVESIAFVVCMDDLAERPECRVKIHTLAEVEALGKQTPVEPTPAASADLATIMYTSGTTGNPKGVMLTHGNLIAELAGTVLVKIYPTDAYLSYLPLAHVFERLMQIKLLESGASIGFFQGSVLKLVDDIATLRPTVFASVPRLFNRIYDRVMAAINASGFKRALFTGKYNKKVELLRAGKKTANGIVFKKIAARLGGRVRVMVTGSAPISQAVLEFFRICFNAEVLEGYGQTETSAAISITRPGDWTTGQVGAPLPCTEIKLVSVEEMNYTVTSNPPCGEICSRGPNIFKGYYKDEVKTREALDDDGFIHSGDIARLNANGTISIIDRKKDIFKLAQGEYIAPERIEIVYTRGALIEQAFVYGDSLQSVLVAIIVPDREAVAKWASQHGHSASFEDLCKGEELKAAINAEMKQLAKAAPLKSFEEAKSIFLESTPFSVENDLLTPSFKIKRPQLRDKYRPVIDEMYQKLATAFAAAASAGDNKAAF